MARGIKFTIDEIRTFFYLENYVLLSDEYKNSRTKLEYICSEGHKNFMTYSNWQQGKRCPECSSKALLKIEFIREAFKEEDYILLSNNYTGNKQKLEYICPNGHKHYIKWNDWKNNHRCPYCSRIAKPTIEQIIEDFEKEGYKLISNQYKNNREALKAVCPVGHEYTISWKNWQKGRRCYKCHIISLYGQGNPSWKGGTSFEPYCEIWKDKEYKEGIKERDGYKCLNPACVSKNPNDLTVHHIDYNKKNCLPKNLITVCRGCNSKANRDRGWYKAWYKAIIKNRYNY